MKLLLLLGFVCFAFAADDPTTEPPTTATTPPSDKKYTLRPDNNDQWKIVHNNYNVPEDGPYCIKMMASIRLEITFKSDEKDKDGKALNVSTKNIFVPHEATWTGSCNYGSGAPTEGPPSPTPNVTTQAPTTVPKAMELAATEKNPYANAQLQRLDIEFYDNWVLGLTFTSNDTAGKKSGKAFILYSMDLTAQLSPDKFNNDTFDNSTQKELELFAKTNTTNNGDYWKAISGSSGHAEECLHIQTVVVKDPEEDGGDGTGLKVDFVNMTVQAFAWDKDFLTRESCPQEIPFDDTVDIVIGAIMSGVVTIVMIIYLIYRLKKGPSQIPKHLMPKPPKTSVSTVDGGTANSGFSPDKM